MSFLVNHRGSYVRKLAQGLGVMAVYADGAVSKLRRGRMSVVVNWGCGSRDLMRLQPYWVKHEILNRAIGNSVLKMRTFGKLEEAHLPHPRISQNAEELAERGRYLGRTDGLTGGAGITVYERGQMPPAGARHDFYSQVVSKAYEVRIHVAGDQVICEQFKFVPPGSQTLIRNYNNGARFSAKALESHLTAEDSAQARVLAVAAIAAVGLDFGAVDMAFTRTGQWVIFETNSAPRISEREDGDVGVAPCTYDAYRGYFQQFIV